MVSPPSEPEREGSSERAVEQCAAILSAASLALRSGVPTQVSQVDNLVSRLWDVMGYLQSHRNTLVPISKLPTELLQQIMFEYAMENDHLFNLRWTRIMLVCHHWHDVALKTQKLWSYVSVVHMFFVHTRRDPWQRIRMQLQNAPSAPLNVRIRFADDASLWGGVLVDDVLNPTRLRSLVVSGDAKHILAWFKTITLVNYPLLESLQVSSAMHADALAEGEKVHVPDNFLDGRAPRLRSLKLNDVSLRWDLLHDVKMLSVSGHHGGTLDEIVSALGRSPALASLEVFAPQRSDAAMWHKANLSELRSLHMLGDVDACSALLSSLLVPGTATLKFHPQGLRSGAEARELVINIRKHFRSELAPVLRSFKIEATSYFLMTAFGDTALHNTLGSDDSSLLYLNSHPFNENCRRQILTKVLKALPVGSLTHVDMRHVDTFANKSWKVLLSLLPSLRVVTIAAQTTAPLTFIEALLSCMDDYIGGKRYPRIQRIHLDATLIHRHWNSEDRPAQIEKGKVVLARLLVLLTRLKEVGHPLDILEFTEAWDIVEPSTTRRLHKLVGDAVIEDGTPYDPEWKKKAYARRLAAAARWREEGMEVSDPDPLSEDSDSP